MEIVGINMALRVAMTSDGFLFPITNLYDEDGDEVKDWKTAIVFVAGPDKAGKWWQAEIAAFGGTIH